MKKLELVDGRVLVKHTCARMLFEYFENSTDKCQVKSVFRHTFNSVSGGYVVITGDDAARCIARFAMTPDAERPRLLEDYMTRAKRTKKGFWEPINGRN
jgi:hypothetical protein